MIDDLKPYSEYKDSGVAWLGMVPAHWKILRLGAVLKERGETNERKQVAQVLSVMKNIGVIPYEKKGKIGNKKSEDISRYKIVRPDDVVVNCMNVIIGSVGISRLTGCLSPVYYVLTRRSKTDKPNYLNAVFCVEPFQRSLVRIGNGILSHRMRIPMELLKCEPFPKPPRDEQVAIVHFINHAKMRIDKAIRAKRKLIALLNEQKQVVIHRAMTRGLNSNAKLKPSGVQWIGHIPVNWTVKRLKWVTRLQRGYDLPQDKRIPGPYPVVSSGGIIGTHCEAKSSGPGIVMGRYGSTNAIFFVEHDFWPHNTSLFVTDFQGNHKRWSYYLLGTISKSDHSSKSAVPGVDRKDLFDIYVPVPSFQEQAILADKIDAEVAGFEKSIKNAEHEITLLREYRTRLISDVVTGKLDVREAAKHLPVKTAELESSMDVDGNETGDEEEFEPALIEGDL